MGLVEPIQEQMQNLLVPQDVAYSLARPGQFDQNLDRKRLDHGLGIGNLMFI